MINLRRKKILAFGLFLALCLTAIYPLILLGNNSIDQKTQQIPKLSQTIDITTPENKTYSESMEGYYPATYGFEETANGVLPVYCDYNPGGTTPDGSGSYGRVEDSWTDGAGNTHNKVFKTYDRTSSGTTHGWLNFTSEGSEIARNSTIEFWACNTQTGLFYHTYFEIWGDLGNMVSFEWDSGGTSNDPEIRITPATGEFGTGVYHEWNRWYRYSIDISCDGGYAGLGANEFRFRIYNETDDLIYASTDLDLLTAHPTGGPHRYHVLSTQSQSDVSHYLDGFGITGLQDGYEIGDNLDEGLLLSFDSSATLDLMTYSLDGQDEVSILGNTTIPFLNDGQHKIQVFGNESGTLHYSNIKYFSIHHIDLITPESITYTEPMEGYYPATYGFEETANGILPAYCDYNPGGTTPDGPGSYGRVEDSWTDGAGNTHNKVFKTYDRTGSGTTHGWLNFTSEGSETIRNSTIEFWACNTNTGSFYHTYFEIWGDLGNIVSFEWDSGGSSNDPEIRITPATGEFGTGVYHEWNRWYRYSIDISCDGGYAGLGANEFRFRIYNETNDLIYASADLDLLTPHPTGGPYRYHVLSTQSQSDVSHYIDAFGITGLQDGYEIGDNLDEGLLLSFESLVSLDTMSYSLDGHDELKVIGNATIPVPDDGQHTIQAFGKDSLDIVYNSEVRYFTTDLLIDIITPENRVYSEPMEGYYPATYGFEETANGILPAYCDYNPGGTTPDGPGSYGRVEDSWTDGAGNTHNKVFKTYDRTGSGTTHGWLNFTSEGSETIRNSTIEFWACNTQTGLFYHTYFEIWGDLGNMVSFEWDSGGTSNDPEIRITPATGEFGTGVYHEWNRWYRYSIDISCDGGYAGLGVNEFRFRIYNETDDLIYASADLDLLTAHPTGGPYRYHVLSTQSQSDVSHYLDAFGITGLQDGYEIEDNLDEGLLLSYDDPVTLDTMSYSLDGQDELKIIGNATIPLPDDGQHTIQVFGEDSLNNKYFSTTRSFLVDTTIPEINIATPSPDEFFGSTTPDFQISFTELNLDSTWYYLGPGTNEVVFSGYTGSIEQDEWDKLGGGPVTIRFYINDTGGLESFDEVIVQKDLTAPTSSISFTPYITPNIVNTSTTFSLAANDGTGSGVSVLRYKINNSNWYDYSTAFDLSGYSYGNYLITYQSIDVVGNVESENTLLVILVEIPSEAPPAIHGFNIVLLLGLISLVSIILIKKYKK